MPKHLIFALLIEVALILMTSVLLMQPNFVFANQSERVRNFVKASGWFLLCATFCWSVIVGCIVTLSSITLRI